jgi:hypothetical protein
LLVGVFLIARPVEALPAVALQSQTVLVVERVAVLFAAWLLALVVVARALAGELPMEISGRGVKYADRAMSQDELLASRRAIDDLKVQVEALADSVAVIERSVSVEHRRYATKGEQHEH